MKIIVILYLLSLPVFAEDVLNIVAVGNAEKESEKIAFSLDMDSSLKSNEKKQLEKMVEIFKEDFKFYKTLFDVDEKTYSTKTLSARYGVFIKAYIQEKKVYANFELKDIKENRVIMTNGANVWLNDLRTFTHDMANIMYKAITGKDSIFKSKIVFVSDRTSSRSKIRKELYIMDFDGERRKRLTYQNSIVISPAISPDNQKVVFTLVDTYKKPNKYGAMMTLRNLNLYALNLGQRKLQLVSNLPGINSGAVFNGDGSHVYLTLSKGANADIYKLNLATKKKRRITTHFAEDVDPSVNADETLMTFLSGRPGKAMIYTMDPSKTESGVKRISFVGDYNAAPRFNPEGSEIVFSSWVDNRFDIYRIGSDGRNLVRLTKNFGSNEEPWFSPDGEFIVFSSQRVLTRTKAVQDLYIMNRNGEIIKKITSGYGKIFTPRWSN